MQPGASQQVWQRDRVDPNSRQLMVAPLINENISWPGNCKYWLRPVFAGLMLIMLLGACAAATPQGDSGQEGTTGEPWSVRLLVTGGFAGVWRSADIDHYGNLTIVDRRRGAHVKATIADPALRQIGMQVRSSVAGPYHRQDRQHSDCRDCFNYTLEVTKGARTSVREYNNVAAPTSRDGPLIQELLTIMQRHLP